MAAPERIGKYRLDGLLASGGMGEVFLAHSDGPAGFSKTLVVKRILQHLAHDEKLVALFVNEAKLAALLSHPNIVQIFELGQDGDAFYLAMEYIHGRSLRAIQTSLMKRARLMAAPMAAHLCSQVLHGLHYAHGFSDAQGHALHIVHRDITPENVLVSFGGAVKVVDFGVAKARTSSTVAQEGRQRGKRRYMAPEQLRGEEADARADLYSVGVVLYELLTGEPPHADALPAELLTAIARGPVPPSERSSGIPAELEAIVLKALRAVPAERFASAGEMASELEAWLLAAGEAVPQGHVTAFMLELFEEASLPQPPAAPPKQSTRAIEGTAEAPTRLDTHLAGDPRESFREEGGGSRGNADGSFDERSTALRSRRSRWPLAVAGLAVAGLAVGITVTRDRSSGAPTAPQPVMTPTQPRETAGSEPTATAAQDLPTLPEGSPRTPEVGTRPQATALPPETEAAPQRTAQPVERATPRVTSRKLAFGRVDVRVHPWAEVFLDHKSLGTTPMSPVRVPAGRHTFVLKNSDLGVERRVTVTVPRGGDTSISANLMEKPAPKP